MGRLLWSVSFETKGASLGTVFWSALFVTAVRSVSLRTAASRGRLGEEWVVWGGVFGVRHSP